eukprot:11154600-Lingulodinium_polyedra.AAC.1
MALRADPPPPRGAIWGALLDGGTVGGLWRAVARQNGCMAGDVASWHIRWFTNLRATQAMA